MGCGKSSVVRKQAQIQRGKNQEKLGGGSAPGEPGHFEAFLMAKDVEALAFGFLLHLQFFFLSGSLFWCPGISANILVGHDYHRPLQFNACKK